MCFVTCWESRFYRCLHRVSIWQMCFCKLSWSGVQFVALILKVCKCVLQLVENLAFELVFASRINLANVFCKLGWNECKLCLLSTIGWTDLWCGKTAPRMIRFLVGGWLKPEYVHFGLEPSLRIGWTASLSGTTGIIGWTACWLADVPIWCPTASFIVVGGRSDVPLGSWRSFRLCWFFSRLCPNG